MRDAVVDRVATLGPDKLGQPVACAEILTFTDAMLMDARSQISRHTDIERSAIAIGHDVHPAAVLLAIHGIKETKSGTPGQARGDGYRNRFASDPVADIGELAHRLKMLRYLVALVTICAAFWIALTYTGYVIVHDETGLAETARVRSGERQQILTRLPFGYFAAIPDMEGEIEVRCADGSKVNGGYVTTHWRETTTVIGEGTCESLI